MSGYEPEVGDRVRVVIETEVLSDDASNAASCLCSGRGYDKAGIRKMYLTECRQDVVSVEKIEPPVVTFEPGDRLRRKGQGYGVTLASDGFLQHFTSGRVGFYSYSTDKPEWFNSDNFDLIPVE